MPIGKNNPAYKVANTIASYGDMTDGGIACYNTANRLFNGWFQDIDTLKACLNELVKCRSIPDNDIDRADLQTAIDYITKITKEVSADV